MFNNSKKHLAAWALLLMLGGCTLAPRYQRPDLPVAEILPDAKQSNAPAATKETVIDAGLGWRDFFVDPQLQQLIQTALANNRDLRTSAQHRVLSGTIQNSTLSLIPLHQWRGSGQ